MPAPGLSAEATDRTVDPESETEAWKRRGLLLPPGRFRDPRVLTAHTYLPVARPVRDDPRSHLGTHLRHRVRRQRGGPMSGVVVGQSRVGDTRIVSSCQGEPPLGRWCLRRWSPLASTRARLPPSLLGATACSQSRTVSAATAARSLSASSRQRRCASTDLCFANAAMFIRTLAINGNHASTARPGAWRSPSAPGAGTGRPPARTDPLRRDTRPEMRRLGLATVFARHVARRACRMASLVAGL